MCFIQQSSEILDKISTEPAGHHQGVKFLSVLIVNVLLFKLRTDILSHPAITNLRTLLLKIKPWEVIL